jgi:hypothetical protein
MSFETWWSKNKDLYTLAGVTESVAKCIWVEAIQSVQEPLSEQIKAIMKSLE